MNTQRVTIKLKNPNPLFEEWLLEWRNKEKEKQSKMYKCYDNALEAMKKYPLPLETGKDCMILQGFGTKLCNMIDDKLKQHRKHDVQKSNDNNLVVCDEPNKKKQKKSPSKSEYTPTNRSGAYAILIALYKSRLAYDVGQQLKNEIIEVAQKYCDKSFMKSDGSSHYTAWSSMSTLITKKLVIKEGNPAKYSLTDEGYELSQKLYLQLNENEDCAIVKKLDIPNKKDVSKESNGKKLPKQTKSKIKETTEETVLNDIFLTAGTFHIYLLVDKQETSGSNKDPVDDETVYELNKLNVDYEVRHLKIGDYAWICKDRNSGEELILPYIVERKRMDDFGASIKDGRFHEQKFRLKQCGIQNLIYLVESIDNNKHTGLPLTTLHQAATNTLIQDGFSVKFTDSLKDTLQYLASFTRILINIYKDKTLMACPKEDLINTSIQDDLFPLMTFKEFNISSSKNKKFKVRDMFIKQLLQLKGLSVDKALAITGVYPTPKALYMKYLEISNSEAENLLSNINFGKLNKKVGPVISKSIYQLYNLKSY